MAEAGLGKHIVWRLEALAYDVLGLVLRPFSFDTISALGGKIVGFFGPKTNKHHIARTGLKIAFPNASEEQINIWLAEQWDNVGRTFAEFLVIHRVPFADDPGRVTMIGAEHLEPLHDPENVAVFVTGHFANWEIMAASVTQLGVPVQVTYRKTNNPYIDKRIRATREAYGTRLMVPKSGARGAKQLLEALKNGESIALMNDQKFNQGISVPFFGTPAMTAPGPVRLALKSGAPLLMLYVTRDKARFTVHIDPPVYLENTGDRTADIEAGVDKVIKYAEDKIRKNPGQWFWVHRRWPKEHYRKPK